MSDDLKEYLISALEIYSSGTSPEDACKTFLSSLLEIASDGELQVFVVDQETKKLTKCLIKLNPCLDPSYRMSRDIIKNVSAKPELEEDI